MVREGTREENEVGPRHRLEVGFENESEGQMSVATSSPLCFDCLFAIPSGHGFGAAREGNSEKGRRRMNGSKFLGGFAIVRY